MTPAPFNRSDLQEPINEGDPMTPDTAPPTPDPTTTLAAWRAVTETITPQRLQFAHELADPDWSLSVPEPAKAVLRDLLPVADAMPRLLAFAEAVLALQEGLRECGDPACAESAFVIAVRAALAEHLGGEGL